MTAEVSQVHRRQCGLKMLLTHKWQTSDQIVVFLLLVVQIALCSSVIEILIRQPNAVTFRVQRADLHLISCFLTANCFELFLISHFPVDMLQTSMIHKTDCRRPSRRILGTLMAVGLEKGHIEIAEHSTLGASTR
jgi:hypothetical protein